MTPPTIIARASFARLATLALVTFLWVTGVAPLPAQPSVSPIRILLRDSTVIRGVIQTPALTFTSSLGTSSIRPSDVKRFASGKLSLVDGTTIVGSFARTTVQVQTVQGILSFAGAEIRELGDAIHQGIDQQNPDPSPAVPADSIMRRLLVGVWRDENSTISYAEDGALTARWDNGSTASGRWSLSDGILSRVFLEANCTRTTVPDGTRSQISQISAATFSERDLGGTSQTFRATRVAARSYVPPRCDQPPKAVVQGCENIEVMGVNTTGKVAGVEVFFIMVRNTSSVMRLVEVQFRPRKAIRTRTMQVGIPQGAIKNIEVGLERPEDIKLRSCR